MDKFLKSVALDLIEKKIDFAQTVIVFPNKRAGLFLNQYLFEITRQPFWTPTYIGIHELLQEESSLQIADNLILVHELFKVYQKHLPSKESLDDFYLWGEMLLGDFDDIDKHKVDTKLLFNNLADIKAYQDPLDFLTTEQLSTLKNFFQNFDLEKSSEIKTNFVNIWKVLLPIYNEFKENLRALHLGYEGMIIRDRIENLNKTSSNSTYIFIGFNALNTCEKELFTFYKNNQKALFYWDYDEYYIQDPMQESALFLRENLKNFPNELKESSLFRHLGADTDKKIQFIAANSESAQARYVNEFLKELPPEEQDSIETAIVLCDESLLSPIINSASFEKSPNITLGFPLNQTPIYSLIQSWLTLHTDKRKHDASFKSKSILGVLEHPYFKEMADKNAIENLKKEMQFFWTSQDLIKRFKNLSFLFEERKNKTEIIQGIQILIEHILKFSRERGPSENDLNVYNHLHIEAAYRTYQAVIQFQNLLNSGDFDINTTTLIRLFKKVFGRLTVPFLGEPILGTQIMGMLETRNLDFKNIILLSVNEGKMPNISAGHSFIPANLRKVFGMTTQEHKTSVSAYYFYRLIQRAKNIKLLYNTSVEGSSKGEMSRFMLQLLMESPHKIEELSIQNEGVDIVEKRNIRVQNTLGMIETIKNTPLSASSLKYFLTCKLKFYLRYIAKLKKTEIYSDEIDAAAFGNLFHKAAEVLYRTLSNQMLVKESGEFEDFKPTNFQSQDLKQFKDFESVVDIAFRLAYFKKDLSDDFTPKYSGKQLLTKKILIDYLKKLLRLDYTQKEVQLLGVEKEVNFNLNIGTESFKIKGYIDRLDVSEGNLRVVDYKTGGDNNPSAIEDVFLEENQKDLGNSFQAFLYCYLLSKEEEYKTYPIQPALIHIAKSYKCADEAILEIKKGKKIEDFREFSEKFGTLLEEVFGQLTDVNTVFESTSVAKNCKFCDYMGICGVVE